ncbi:MAG: DUF1311 domain-containing protein [Proteobacteria bacterium]|nr:DUF1311 domain-containing protein [Pseudomonadota bacterium]
MISRIKLVILFVFFLSNEAIAIDCVKAMNDAEKQICKDSNLNSLDIRLNVEYEHLSKLLNKDTKKKLLEIQKTWLSYRNNLNGRSDIADAYKKQRDFISFSTNAISILEVDPAKMFNDFTRIYKLTYDETGMIPEVSEITKFDEFYFVEFSSMRSRFYVINVSKNRIGILLESNVSIISPTTNGLFVLVSESFARHGVGGGALSIIYRDSKNDLGLSSMNLVNLSYDAESGGCGRGSSIGIEKAVEIGKYTTDKGKDSVILTLQLKEENCVIRSKVNKIRKFSITDGEIKEI